MAHWGMDHVRSFAEKHSGHVVKIPAGTPLALYIGDQQSVGVDTYVQITIDPEELTTQVVKALRSKSGKSRDGSVTVKRLAR